MSEHIEGYYIVSIQLSSGS